MTSIARLPLAVLLLTLSFAGSAPAQGYLCAEGGGNEQNGNWAPSVFGWMVDQASNKNVVILGISGSDAGMAATFMANGASSVTNLAVNTGNADLQATYDTIAAAGIVWMRGGDQSQYVNRWNDTLTEQAIVDVYMGGGVVGGTSAGCAVLSEVIYDAQAGSLTPRQALQNPYHPNFTFTDDFLELGTGTLLDTHFTERGRLGRLAVLVARWFEDTGEDVVGIGVDDRTALCVYPDLTAEVRGEGAVTFLHRTSATRQSLASGEAPDITDLSHTQLTEGYRYDLVSRSVLTRPAGAVLVGAPGADPSFSATSLSGTLAADDDLGDVALSDQGPGNDFAIFDGAMSVSDGANALLRTVVATRVWGSTTWDENRVGGPQYACALNPHFLALYLDANVFVDALPSDLLAVRAPNTGSERSAMLLDTHGLTSVAFSTYVSGGGSVGPRQSVALEGAKLDVVSAYGGYDASAHAALLAGDAWADLGASLAGTGAAPRLEGAGLLADASPFRLSVADALPGTTAFFVVGLSAINAPFKGGTLVPNTDQLVPVPVSGAGEVSLPGTWPAGLPSGTDIYLQVWGADAGAPVGFAASNAIVGTTR